MSCELKVLGQINDLAKVQEFFGLCHDNNWFNAIFSGFSPTSEVIAVGQGEKLLILSSCWDNKSNLTTYAITWSGELEDRNDIITSIICLPIFGKSASCGPEWTCVTIGVSSGKVLFYTDSGVKLFSQCFHNEPVVNIKAHSSEPPYFSESFLYIVYDKCVCSLKGSDIFPLLRKSRYNLRHRFPRNAAVKTTYLEISDICPYHTLSFDRSSETIINDAVVAETSRQSVLDYMIEQYHTTGSHATFSDAPVQKTLVLGVGAEPYMGFYYAQEGYTAASLGDFINIACNSVLGRFRRTIETPLDKAEQAKSSLKETQMRSHCCLHDGKRIGFTITMAPGGRLAVVTDNLNRVILVETYSCTMLRVWKGYRDAQCAFIQVKEKSLKNSETPRRKALFLVIYAPHLGSLEVWTLQNGPRVAAFTVTKNGYLIYNSHGLLGVQAGLKMKVTISSCLFFDPGNGTIKEIQVPFHYALTEWNAKTAKDIHLLRRLKTILRGTDTDLERTQHAEEIEKIILEFQTIEIRQQCIEMLLKKRQLKPETFQLIINSFMHALNETECSDEELQFLKLNENYKSLTDFYIALKTPEKCEFDWQLKFSACDLVTINDLVELLRNKSFCNTNVEGSNARVGTKVTFQAKCEEVDFVEFLSIFHVQDCVSLNQSKADFFSLVSAKLFTEFYDYGLSFIQLKNIMEASKISYNDLITLVLHFWMKKPFSYENCDEVFKDMSKLGATVSTICELAGDIVNNYAYNSISHWWQNVREILLENSKSLGILIAIVCKTVAVEARKKYNKDICDENLQTDDDRWEEISHDEAQWGLLIGKLEDVAVLSAILEKPITSEDPVMPIVPYKPPECNLKFIVCSGKGIVCDLTAHWLISSRIHPSKLLESPLITTSEQSTDINNEDKTQESTEIKHHKEIDSVIEKLALLRRHFPFSLESGMLLTMMSWHYMTYWSKNLHSLDHMRAAICCMSQFDIKDNGLKHGLCCVLWNTSLKFLLQSTAKLIEKVGRLPRDKMCQQDIEISSTHVPEFLALTQEFLHHFINSVNGKKRELKFEESLTEGQPPLHAIALQQHQANENQLDLHYQLSVVLYFIAIFQLKMHKPITTLFGGMGDKELFQEISKEPVFIPPSSDISLQQSRTKFLCKVITASMDLIREDLEQLFMVEHLQTMDKIYDLANSWNLDKNILKKQQIVDMYAYGYDAAAEKLFIDLELSEDLGNMLLEVAGKRLNVCARNSADALMKIASIGQILLQYLDELEASHSITKDHLFDSKEVDIRALTRLTSYVVRCLSVRQTRNLSIAAQMYDACRLLQE